MLKVLIVDDEAVVRRGIVLGIDWASLGCAVVGEAANGEEGLAAAERYSPNLIITDVRMPHMDGIEMMRVLRERGSLRRENHLRCFLTPTPLTTFAQQMCNLVVYGHIPICQTEHTVLQIYLLPC